MISEMAKSVRRFFPQQIFKPSEMPEAFLRAFIIFDDEVTKSHHSSPFSTSELQNSLNFESYQKFLKNF